MVTTTRYDMRHVRIDTYRQGIGGEVSVKMIDLRYGWTASASDRSETRARDRCIRDLEFRKDLECLRTGKRFMAEIPFWEFGQ